MAETGNFVVTVKVVSIGQQGGYLVIILSGSPGWNEVIPLYYLVLARVH